MENKFKEENTEMMVLHSLALLKNTLSIKNQNQYS